MGGFKKKEIGKIKELLIPQSLLAIPEKKRNMVISLCCDHLKEVKYDCEKSLKEEKRQERRTKKEMEPAKDMLSFELWACWQHLMNGRL